jgi:D-3-phosphoglycerate dehydrogenase
MTHKILVSDKISDDGIAVFEKAGFHVDHLPEITQEQIKERIGEYSAWVIRSRSRATADIIERAHKLRVIGRAGVGVDNVDAKAATLKGIIVMNTPGGNTISTAEHTISMLLSLARKIPQAHMTMKAGQWDKKSAMGVELLGKTLGVCGLGRIGQEVTKRLKAFGMHVLGYDPFISEERMRQLGVESCTVDQICERADFITVHTPLSAETKDLINRERIAKMKKTVRIVNCARGGIINEEALLEALKTNRIAGAALDVFVTEPLPADSEFRKLDNVVITPHIAASTVEAQENVAIEVAQQIVDVLNGGVIRNATNAASVDPELLPVLAPWMDLAERLGSFIAQLRAGKAIRINCRYSGPLLSVSTDAVTTAAVQGFVRPFAEGPVNFVNARQIVRDRGIEIVDTHHSEVYQYENLMTVEVTYEDGTVCYASGTLFGRRLPRIVILNGKHLDAVPEGTLIVLENNDVPGIVGRVGTIMGNNNINIAQMTWGRVSSEGTAMTVINVDGEVSESVLAELRAAKDINWVKLIRI